MAQLFSLGHIRAMKTLTKIEIVLTVLLLIVGVAMARSAAWLNAMHFSDPAREHLLQARISPVADIAWYVTFFPWLIFTPIYLIVLFIHCGAWIFGKFSDRDKDDHVA